MDLEALETASYYVVGVCVGWDVRHQQHNVELNYANQSIVFVHLILRNANYFEMSVFAYNVVLEVLGLMY